MEEPPPTRRRERRPWQELWRTGDNLSLMDFTSQLPSFSTDKNDLLRCTMNHVDREEDTLAATWHEMRCKLTKCTSNRCAKSDNAPGLKCEARYKILQCAEADFTIVYGQGDHTMAADAPPSPTLPKLTPAMKSYIEAKMDDTPSMVAQLVFAFLCREINAHRIDGPSPELKQVQNYVKSWKQKHKQDSMGPVIEICKRSMFDLHVPRSDDDMLVFCDYHIVDGAMLPLLGTGSDANPFRIGLTCMKLLKRYIVVQSDPALTTVMHLDSTHGVVKQKFPVFVVGISDCSGSFQPIVYFCTSSRRAPDVCWCLSFLKRVIFNEFGAAFAPKFTMVDADNAQYNACVSELPETTILMCWFHVCQNVFKHCKDAKLPGVSKQLIFRNLYDLHFSPTEEYYLQKRDFVIKSWRGAGVVCPRFKRVADHIISMWLLNDRFSRWQAYHTPPGYVATNNPLETYHHTLKLVNDSKRATPTELLVRLDLSRIAYISSMVPFSSEAVVSKCMKAAFIVSNKKKTMKAEVVLRVQNRDLVMVKVSPVRGIAVDSSDSDSEYFESLDRSSDAGRSYKSSNYERMHWFGMPEGGWIVDATGRTCSCRVWLKYGMCFHVIKATQFADLRCPGMPDPQARFVTKRSQVRSRRSRQRATRADAPQLEPVLDCEIVYGPPLQINHAVLNDVDIDASGDQVHVADENTNIHGHFLEEIAPDGEQMDYIEPVEQAVRQLFPEAEEANDHHPEQAHLADGPSAGDVESGTSSFVSDGEDAVEAVASCALDDGQVRRSTRRRQPSLRARESYAVVYAKKHRK